MKIAIAVLMVSMTAVGQSKAPAPKAAPVKTEPFVFHICKDDADTNCVQAGHAIINSIAPPEYAKWSDEVKGGVYTASLVDKQNHWRCFVTGAWPEGNLHAFTVTCIDTTAGNTPMPAPSKEPTR